MPKKYVKRYILLAAFLFSIVALPPLFVETLRFKFISAFMPLFKGVNFTQKKSWELCCKKLEGENQLLKSELSRLKLLLEQIGVMDPQSYEKKGVSAQVIFRDPGNWSSSLWVNVGEETNKKIKAKIIEKNSLVLFGKSVVGVVDHVGMKQSRVCLITDSNLKISVRAARGAVQNMFLKEQMELFSRSLMQRKDLPITQEDKALLLNKLSHLKVGIDQNKESLHLAKGILQGSHAPLWRKNHKLKGIGFNYDFDDAYGKARDLTREGIIEVNDLIVTTGMDGVFPPNLPVGEVTKVYPLKEGAYYYDIDVVPLIDMNELTTVFIYPPIER